MYNLYKIHHKMLKIFINDYYNDYITESNYFNVIQTFVIKDVFLKNVNDKDYKIFYVFKNEI